MHEYPDIFNTVFGPVMQGGSSSHTAGPCRIGFMANCLVSEELKEIKVLVDKKGSFSRLFGLMQEDLGMLAGALGFLPHDARLFDVYEIAKERGIKVDFVFDEMKESLHRGAMKFILTGQSGKLYTLVGDSVVGGTIEVKVINGFPVSLKGDAFVLVVESALEPSIVDLLKENLTGYFEHQSAKRSDGQIAHFFLTSEKTSDEDVRQWLGKDASIWIKPVMPSLKTAKRKPQLFSTLTEWRHLAEEKNLPLHEVAIQYQMDHTGWTRDEVIAYMKTLFNKLERQTKAAYDEPKLKMHPYYNNPFSETEIENWTRYTSTNEALSGPVMSEVIKGVWSVLAMPQGVELVPGPMGLGGGVMYASMRVMKEQRGFSEEDMINALFVAGGIGIITYTHTVPAGEVIGCTGEVGMSSTMAAAALTHLFGGTPRQVEAAASMTLQSLVGIPCDPIAGGNMQPCASRSVMGACLSLVFADMALSGRLPVLTFQDSVMAADRHGKAMAAAIPRSKLGCVNTDAAVEKQDAFIQWHNEKVEENTI